MHVFNEKIVFAFRQIVLFFLFNKEINCRQI